MYRPSLNLWFFTMLFTRRIRSWLGYELMKRRRRFWNAIEDYLSNVFRCMLINYSCDTFHSSSCENVSSCCKWKKIKSCHLVSFCWSPWDQAKGLVHEDTALNNVWLYCFLAEKQWGSVLLGESHENFNLFQCDTTMCARLLSTRLVSKDQDQKST